MLLITLSACATDIPVRPTSIPSASVPAPDKPSPEPTERALLNPLEAEEMVHHFESPAYGIHTAQWWDLVAFQNDINRVNDMHFGWVKQHIPWRDVEGVEKGSYDWWRPDKMVEIAEAADINLIVRLDRPPVWSIIEYESMGLRVTENQPPVDLQDFGDFCGAMAARYAGRIQAYQVWNEPNLSREWGELAPDPEKYVELLQICYDAIKAADPEAIVISAGLAPTGTTPPDAMPDDQFLRAFYAAGGSNYFDVLGLNAPGYKAPPEISPDETGPESSYGQYRWHVFRHVEDMRRIMVENGDAEKQIAILEMGWTTDTRSGTSYEWHAVSQDEQADYLVRAYEYAETNWQPWIGVMTTIYFSDVAWTEADEQYWWAITEPDGSTRPAFEALKEMRREQTVTRNR